MKTYGQRKFSWAFIVADVKTPMIGAHLLSLFGLVVDIKRRRLCDSVTALSSDSQLRKASVTIQIGGSNMAVDILKNVQNSIKLSVHRFLGSLNPNLPLNFQNSKWRIQYSGPKFEKQEKISMQSHINMFLGSRNPNLLSNFKYPRLRNPYGV